MITSECICRVLYFIAGDSAGTCFSYEKSGKQVLITARHIFENLKFPNNSNLSFNLANGINKINCDIYYHDNVDIDIAIIDPKCQLTQIFVKPKT